MSGRTENVAHLLRQLATWLDEGTLTEAQLALLMPALTEQLDPGAPRRALEETAAGMLKFARQMPTS